MNRDTPDIKIVMIAGSEVTLSFSPNDNNGWTVEVSILSGKADHARIKSFRTHGTTREEVEGRALDQAGHHLGNNAGAVKPMPATSDPNSPTAPRTDG